MLIRDLPPLALLIAAGAIGTAAAGQQASSPPPGPGLDLINERCAFCHTTAQVLSVRKSPEAWASTVQLMIDRGAELNADEEKAMIDYLIANFAEKEGKQRGQP
jgi:hypothetical protein